MSPPADPLALPPLSPTSHAAYLSLDPLSDLPPLDLPLPLALPPSPLSHTTAADTLAFPPPSPPAPPALPRAELAARLAAATTENRALRARVAALARENRALRAAARAPPPPAEPLRKRARPAAGPPRQTTMACVLLLAGALFATPSLRDGLGAGGAGGGVQRWAGAAGGGGYGFTPARPGLGRLRALPRPDDVPGGGGGGGGGGGVVAVRGGGGARADLEYVMCRDGEAAGESVRGCAARMRAGGSCTAGAPYAVSLVVPARAAGLNWTVGGRRRGGGDDDGGLAEVLCHVVSVARVPDGVAPAVLARGVDAGGVGRIVSAVVAAAA